MPTTAFGGCLGRFDVAPGVMVGVAHMSIVQRIQPASKRNASTFFLLGGGGLLIMLLIDALIYPIAWPFRLSLAAFCLISMALGVAKWLEPPTTLEITPNWIRYHDIRGSWELPWDDIQRFDIPDVQRGLEKQQLPFLGLRLKSYDKLLQQISPRLAVRLLYQQRAFMIQVLRSEKPAHREYQEYFEIPDVYETPEGHRYHGILATFAMRMALMREMLGYDLFIAQNAFDRPLPDFIAHLKALQATRAQHLDTGAED